MQPFDPHAVHVRLADLIPGAQRAHVIVLHEKTGAEDVERVCVA
jgi:hypothetical protein